MALLRIDVWYIQGPRLFPMPAPANKNALYFRSLFGLGDQKLWVPLRFLFYFMFLSYFLGFGCGGVRERRGALVKNEQKNHRSRPDKYERPDSLDPAFGPPVQPREPVADHAACAVKGRVRVDGQQETRQECRHGQQTHGQTPRVTLSDCEKRLLSASPGKQSQHRLKPGGGARVMHNGT